MNIDNVYRAYVECALWSSTDGDDDEPMDAHYGIDDLADETVATMKADCESFLHDCDMRDIDIDSIMSDEQCGHDFWLTRNRHGAGFWDRGYGQIGDTLSDIAHPYGETWIYVGDDGEVYC